jgi:aldehyde:ferredoxin oxidoreductase
MSKRVVKPKKRCCKSTPRCKRCPVVCKRLAKQGLAERRKDGRYELSATLRKKQLKRARA